jgi:hypothetical protein
MEHHFNIEIAQKYGVNEAIFLNNIAHWILHNKANEKHFHKNRYWTYNTARAFLNLFPYWSTKNLRTIIDNCVGQGLIIKGNFNTRKSDRTLWYALSDEGLKLFPAIGKVDLSLVADEDHLLETANETQRGLQGDTSPTTRVVEHLPETAHPFAGNGTALPYIKPDNKQKIKEMVVFEMNLPEWLNEERWEEFRQHRKFIKKPMSKLAEKKIINKLIKFRALGHNPFELLDLAIEHSWSTVYIPKQFVSSVHKINHAKNETKSTVKFFEPGNPDYDRIHGAR